MFLYKFEALIGRIDSEFYFIIDSDDTILL